MSFLFAQNLNQVVVDDKGNKKLLGITTKAGLQQTPFLEWFDKNHEAYLENKAVIKKLKPALSDYTIKAFFGSWCGDSKLHLPEFYKILEAAKYPMDKLEVIAVDRTKEAYKQAPGHEEKGLNIHRVPTFIFYKDGQEVNRIVEHPLETLERDILKIVTDNKYTPNYMVVNYMIGSMATTSIDSLKLMENNLIPRLAERVKGSRELNTFGYSLLRSQQINKAIYIFELNTKIFPYKHNVYDSLGEAYYETKNYSEALKNYYKVLSIRPDDKNAKEMVSEIEETMK
jgi:tetratricopeptide (TPR) repeat protein